MAKKYLSIFEASKYLTLARSTIYTYIHYQKIPFMKIGGRIVFEETVLDKWMQSKQKKEK